MENSTDPVARIPRSKARIVSILFLLLLVIAIPLTVITLQHRQETRQRASTTSIPAFVQENENKITSGTTVSTTFAKPNTAGNLIAVYVLWNNAGTASIKDSLGNTYTSATGPLSWNNNTWRGQVFYAKNILGGSNTITVTFSQGVTSFGIMYTHEYSGLDPANPIDVTQGAIGTSSAMSSGLVTTTNANDLIFGAGASSAGITAGESGFTVRTTGYGNMTEDEDVTNTGSYAATATQNSVAWIMQMVAFKAASTTLSPSPTLATGTAGVCSTNAPVDVVLLVDTSGSMSEPAQSGSTATKITQLKQAATSFVNGALGLANNNYEISLVSFTDKATILSDFTNNVSTLTSDINSLQATNTTCTECGVDAANQEITNHGRSNVKKAVILLTDGFANVIEKTAGNYTSSVDPASCTATQNNDKACTLAETPTLSLVTTGHTASNTTYFTIGLGTAGTTVNQNFLQQIADSTTGQYYNDPTGNDLTSIYTNLQEVIGQGGISGFVFNDTNANGQYDSTETKVTGRTVTLSSSASGTSTQSTVTDATGDYSFVGLCNGNYTITDSIPSGSIITDPKTNNGVYIDTITNDQTIPNQNFGEAIIPTSTPIPTPPSAPVVTINGCITGPVSGTNNLTLSWNDSNVSSVNIGTDPSYSTYYAKNAPGVLSTTAPIGFFGGSSNVSGLQLVLSPNTTYYATVWDGVTSQLSSQAPFSLSLCATPTPTVTLTPTPKPTNTPTPTATPVPTSTLTPTPRPTNTPTPTPTFTPTPTPRPTSTPTPIPTDTPFPTSTPVPLATTLNFTVFLHGIGNSGDNANPNTFSLSNHSPLHPERPATIEVYDSNNQLVKSTTGTLTYSSNAGNFTANTISLGTAFTTGDYNIKIKTDRYLKKLVPGIVHITAGQSNLVPTVTLVAGDINGDNNLNILDYNTLLDCGYGAFTPLPMTDPNSLYNSASCQSHQPYVANADLNDDGTVDYTDFNLFVRELSVQNGD